MSRGRNKKQMDKEVNRLAEDHSAEKMKAVKGLGIKKIMRLYKCLCSSCMLKSKQAYPKSLGWREYCDSCQEKMRVILHD